MVTTASTVAIRLSTVAELRERCSELFAAHWDDVARNKELMQLAPDWCKYENLELAGLLQILVASDVDAIVGYSVTCITTHLHYADLLYAHNEALFVVQSHRARGIGLRLIRETESHAYNAGARMMLWHAKQGSGLDRLFQRRGYAAEDVIYSRELG